MQIEEKSAFPCGWIIHTVHIYSYKSLLITQLLKHVLPQIFVYYSSIHIAKEKALLVISNSNYPTRLVSLVDIIYIVVHGVCSKLLSTGS